MTPYTSPEELLGGDGQTAAGDGWAAGCLLLDLFEGPFLLCPCTVTSELEQILEIYRVTIARPPACRPLNPLNP